MSGGIDGRSSEVRIQGLNYLLKNIDRDDRLLIVDDVFDTGATARPSMRCCAKREARPDAGGAASCARIIPPTGRPSRFSRSPSPVG